MSGSLNIVIRRCKHLIFMPRYQIRNMNTSQTNSGEHLQVTARQTRSNITTKAAVIKMSDISPSVKLLTLQAENPQFTFKAGQWVDLYIPDINMVGGFSICSSPLQKETFDLAVKFSNHPPAEWIHTKCSVGSKVSARSGGDFFFHLDVRSKPTSLLLLAGGVGINPLASIFRYVADIRRQTREDGGKSRIPIWHGKLALLYSARSQEELLFRDDLTKIASEHKDLQCKFFVTRQSNIDNSQVTGGRISMSRIKSALDWLQTCKTNRGDKTVPIQAMICGPASFMSDMQLHLHVLTVSESRIMVENYVRRKQKIL